MRDISKDLRIQQVDEAELRIVIGSRFNHHRSDDDLTFTYHRSQNVKPALRVIYSKTTQQLVGIETEEDFQPEDLEALAQAVESDLVADQGEKIGRRYLFGSYPVNAGWGYMDVRLLPVPPNSPLPSQFVAEHPFILEFLYRDSPNYHVASYRREEKSWELSLFFGTVLEGSVYAWDNSHPHYWVLHPSKVDGNITELAQRWYEAPGFKRIGDPPLSEVASTMDIIPAPAYYEERGLKVGQDLRIPESLEKSYSELVALDEEKRAKYLRAAYWFRHANMVDSASASLASLVQSVEALLPPPSGEQYCKECKRLISDGPTKRFSDFLEKLAPGAKLANDRRVLYAARSRIVHGHELLSSDFISGIGTGLSPGRVQEWNTYGDALKAARVALVSWLGTPQ